MTRLVGIAVAVLVFMMSPLPALADGSLVADWGFNEGSGTHTADSSGYGNDGVLSGDATWVPGHTGTALRFAGSSGYVEIPDNPSLEPQSAVTVSAWVKQNGSPGDFRYIVAKGTSGCFTASYGLYTGPNGGIQFYVARDREGGYVSSPDYGVGVWDGNWHLIVGTFDGATVRLFVDGREVGAGTNYSGGLVYMLPNTNDLFIGDYPGNDLGCMPFGFVGMIDDVMIWDRALAPAEITTLMPTLSATSTSTLPSTSTGTSAAGSSRGSMPDGVDTTKTGRPMISHLKLSPSVITLGHRRGPLRRKHFTAPTISYTDTEVAHSTLTVWLSKLGVRQGKRCTTPRRHAGRRAVCIRWIAAGSFVHNDHAGRNSFRFNGLPHRTLAAGRYRLTVTPRAHGNVGGTIAVPFTVRP